MVGKFCVQASTAPEDCAIGTYNDFSNTAEECLACPEGYRCAAAGTINPDPCPAGFWSPSGAGECSYCRVGHHCPHSVTTLSQMLVEQECPGGVLCALEVVDVGTVGLAVWPNNQDHGCPVGHYCPTGTAAAVACPIGTYNPALGRKDASDCLQADPGRYVDTTGASAVSGECAPGYYCPIGSTSATQVPCPLGTWRTLTAGVDAGSCGTCPSGSYCPQEGLPTPIVCTQGFYCARGTVTPEPCPLGTFGGAAGLTDSRNCENCPSGRYCWKTGLTTGDDSPLCDAGFFCIGGSSRPEPMDEVTGRRCPAGSYCLEGTTSPASCAAGTFNAYEGGASALDCTPCWPGYYCEGPSNGGPTGLCPAGFYCPEGTHMEPSSSNELSGLAAAAGHYAPEGSAQQW